MTRSAPPPSPPDEIRQSYELGSAPYRLHTNSDGTFVTPVRVYDGKVYVLDDVATMDIGNRQIATDTSKLIYFVKGDGVAALLCKEIEDPLEVEVCKEILVIKYLSEGPEGPPGKIGKMGHVVWLEHVVKKVARELLVLLVNKDL